MSSSHAPAPDAAPRTHLPHGTAGEGPWTLAITPESAGWGYSSLRTADLAAGQSVTLDCGGSEWIVLPLSGSCTVRITDAGAGAGDNGDGAAQDGAAQDGATHTFHLHGRPSVFEAVTDFAYAPRDSRLTVTAGQGGGRYALTGARCTRRLQARYGPASAVPVEIRGAGQATRQVNNFAAAGVFEADKLIAVEVLTPAGNWSSYPPHKHDEPHPGEESVLEEVYYYEFAPGGPSDDPDRHPGLGYQRIYPSREGGTELLAEVRSGDAVLMPDGWHGPSMALPGHHMYYLNVMAGPDPDRAWLIRDDPDHGWIRTTWTDQPPDPRLPLYSAPAPAPAANDDPHPGGNPR